MHWLLILSLLSSTTNVQPGTSSSKMNSLAETALRRQIGGARVVRVNIAPGAKGQVGDFTRMNVTLDGFSVDQLMNLEDGNTGNFPREEEDYLRPNQLDLGDIFSGGGIFGDILGGVLGGGRTSEGRVGSLTLNATNFTYQGVRYDGMNLNLGEIKFDWRKALQGEFDVKSVQPGSLGLKLRAEQAQKLIAPRLPSVQDVKMRFSNGTAYVGGRTNLYGAKIPFEVGGRLSVQGNEVRADNISVSVARLRLPSVVVKELTKGVNPIYDFDPNNRWPMAVNLNTADGGSNTLAMRGNLQWLGLNRDRNEDANGNGDDDPYFDNGRDNDPYFDNDGEDYPYRDQDGVVIR